MPDVASLQFSIDSSQAQRAVAVLETLKASSIAVTQATAQQNNVQAQLTQGYGQQRDALARLADQTKSYDGTLSGLIQRLNDMRTLVDASRSGFVAYTTSLNQAQQAALGFNATVAGLDAYVAKTRELNITIRDTATAFASITAAQQNMTVQGNAARTALEQMGVSLRNIGPNDQGLVLQQIADRLRSFRDTAGTLGAAQSVLGPSFDAAALQRLERQPYIPIGDRDAERRRVQSAAQIDATRFQAQRRSDAVDRDDAELADLRTRFTQDPTVAGRLGLNISGGTSRLINQTRSEELSRLREIQNMSPEQRQQYTGLGAQVTTAFQGAPGSQDQGIIGWLGRTFRQATSGTYSANEEDIIARQREERNRLGFLPALGGRISNEIANLPGVQDYIPRTTDDRRLSAPEQLSRRRASGQVLASFGDDRLSAQTEATEAYTQFTEGDRARDYNLVSPGIARPGPSPDLPLEAGGRFTGRGPDLPLEAGGGPPPAPPIATGVQRQRYIDAYGAERGNQLYEQQLGNIRLRTRYAGEPAQQIADETTQNRALLAVAPEERVRARQQLDFVSQVAGPAAAILRPGETIQQRYTAALSPGDAQRGQEQFTQGVKGSLQTNTEEADRQINLQDRLTEALKQGRAAAEDVTRSYGAYVDAKVRLNASDPDATKAGVEALNVALRQRGTQATAQTEAIRQQNTLNEQKLEQAKAIQQLDPVTKIIMAGQLDVRQQIATEQQNGTLPALGGGSFTNDQGQRVTVAAPQAAGIIAARQRVLEQQQTDVRGSASQETSTTAKDQLTDSEDLLKIMQAQNVTMQQANQILQIQKGFRQEIAEVTERGSAADKANLENRQQQALSDTDQATANRQRTNNVTVGRTAEITGSNELLGARAPAGRQAVMQRLIPWLQQQIQSHVLPPGTTMEQAVAQAEAGNLPDIGAQTTYNQITMGFDSETGAAVTTGTRDLRARSSGLAARAATTRRLGPGAAARIPIIQQTSNAGLQPLQAQQQTQAAIDAQAAEEAAQSFSATTAAQEARARAGAAALPVSRAAGAGAALGITQQVAAGTRQFDPQGLSVTQRTYEALNQAIAQNAEEIAKASLATRTEIEDQKTSNEAILAGSAAYKAAAIDAQAAAQIRVLEGYKAVAQTKAETDAINANIAAVRGKAAEDKQLAQSQAEGQLNQRTRSEAQQTAIEQADIDAGPLAGQQTLRRVQAQASLDQLIKEQHLEGTPAAAHAQTQLDASQATRDAAEQMNNLREAAHGAGNAVESAFDAIVIHGERGRTAARNLVETLGDLILKAAVFKPLENLIGSAFTGPSAGAAGGGGGFWGAIGSFLGGAGGGAAAAGAAGSAAGASNAAILAGTAGLYAAGGAFEDSPGLHAYSEQVVSRPTLFRFATGGQVGQMGEGGGPEAIMPLRRDASGRLGVAGAGGGTNVTIHTPITVNAPSGGGGQAIDPATLKALQRQLDQTVRQSVRGVISDEKRPGGNLYH